MKISQLIGERFKERPTGCVIDSHALMYRGGYMKYVANGSFSQYPPLRRVCRKIEAILRQEMDRLDGQEVLFPAALPASLWEESGRYQSVGRELFRFQDRSGIPMVLGMTHEEAAVQLVREYAQTYAKYPFMIYQIQTKFRDEARPRGGLIRVREFTMKDAYSFHTSQKDLERYYTRCLEGYHRIFARVGLPEVIAVASDSGMMGGSLSHEFMLLTPVGEDTIVRCPHCGFCANKEAVESSDMAADISPESFSETCPACGQRGLTLSRGIEVGNIFQLGTKYTEAMGMQYLDQEGNPCYPLMGCYGIGVERLAASICEARHDERGPIWPVSVAPWQVHLCCVRADDAQTKEAAGRIYRQMEDMGLEVLYDDRNVRAGVMFSDADLLGAPVRVIISPRNCQEGKGELTLRDKSRTELISLEEIAGTAGRWVRELAEQLESALDR
ncbi:MAG: hypothetical protein HFE44_08125 [Oscillospiraceae bacterium]|jgi:prolyl-tRNA synthetase|nr:hypothetical protein [Oscillospiraceae bacterium]